MNSRGYSYVCEFCGEYYSDYEAHRMRMCCCGEQLSRNYEEDDEE